MKMRYDGSFQDLRILLLQSGFEGNWQPEPNQVFMFRSDQGANLHWASTTKTMWVDGAPSSAQALRLKLCELLAAMPTHG